VNFPTTVGNWEVSTLLKQIRRTGTIDRQPGSGTPRSVRVSENIENVEDLVIIQKAPIDS